MTKGFLDEKENISHDDEFLAGTTTILEMALRKRIRAAEIYTHLRCERGATKN